VATPALKAVAKGVPGIAVGLTVVQAGLEVRDGVPLRRAVAEGSGSLIGGAVGGVVGSFIPIPVVGTVVGSAVGSYLGGKLGDVFADRFLKDH
jgi:phage tail tape-measure protein